MIFFKKNHNFAWCTLRSVSSPPKIECHVPLTNSYYYYDYYSYYCSDVAIKTCICLFSVKFLEVIKPFCAVLPEIQKPERKVSLGLLLSKLLDLMLKINHMVKLLPKTLTLSSNRFSSEKRCYGQPSPFLSSWSVVR